MLRLSLKIDVEKDGYQWVDAYQIIKAEGKAPRISTDTVRVLTSYTAWHERRVMKRVDLYSAKANGLPQQFARVTPTEEGILTFANQYGLLNPPYSRSFIFEGENLYGVWIGDWMRAINAVNRAVNTWDAITDGDYEYLDNHFIATEYIIHSHFIDDVDGTVFREPQGGNDYFLMNNNPLFAEAKKDKRIIAKMYLTYLVNKMLQENNAVSNVQYSHKDQSIIFYPTNANLLGCIWYRFALQITQHENKNYRQCQVCGEYFLAERKTAKYCSNYCRLKQHRMRTAENHTA